MRMSRLTSSPNTKYDDQADSTSQALDWFKQSNRKGVLGLNLFFRQENFPVDFLIHALLLQEKWATSPSKTLPPSWRISRHASGLGPDRRARTSLAAISDSSGPDRVRATRRQNRRPA